MQKKMSLLKEVKVILMPQFNISLKVKKIKSKKKKRFANLIVNLFLPKMKLLCK